MDTSSRNWKWTANIVNPSWIQVYVVCVFQIQNVVSFFLTRLFIESRAQTWVKPKPCIQLCWSRWLRCQPRGGICPCRQCRRQCKIFASGVNFSIFTHCLCFFPLKLLKLSEIDGVNFLAWKYGGVHFWTNSMSDSALQACMRVWSLDVTKLFYFGRLVRCRSQKTNLISSFSKFDRSQKQLEK